MTGKKRPTTNHCLGFRTPNSINEKKKNCINKMKIKNEREKTEQNIRSEYHVF